MKSVSDLNWQPFSIDDVSSLVCSSSEGQSSVLRNRYRIKQGSWAPVFHLWEEANRLVIDVNLSEFSNSEIRLLAGKQQFRFYDCLSNGRSGARVSVWPPHECPLHAWLLALPGDWDGPRVGGAFSDGQLILWVPKNSSNVLATIEIQVGMTPATI